MADVYKAYKFLNKELGLGISSEVLVRGESIFKQKIAQDNQNTHIASNPDEYKFVFTPVRSDLLRAYKELRDLQKLNISDEQLMTVTAKYMMAKEGKNFNIGTHYAAFLVSKNPSIKSEIVWAQPSLQHPNTNNSRGNALNTNREDNDSNAETTNRVKSSL